MNEEKSACAACGRTIDTAAKLCPYCGANPQTGERIDTQAILQEIFRPRSMTRSESVLEYARQRQGIVIMVSAIVAFLLLAAVHQFVTMRNANVVTDTPDVPLTEITDVANQRDDATPARMPALDFQYDGNPRTMRTYIMERGAVTPPEVVAVQQAAALAKQQAAQQAKPPAPAPAAQPRPQLPAPRPR